ncbi:PulJ/GspJ family protein [Alteromonas flava]|uniref:PulJ/GspJ family protein n=1 Tax=Alteromonas flava TaxID=2048003 RepID=UPI0013D93431|nr:type II secretion system protein [Alteromonas flava]
MRMRGFTLLEMMVVLVLVSLITVLMMQGFSFVTGLQERIRKQLVQVQDVELREQWFRVTVRSMHRGRKSDDAQFTGDRNEFSGLTLQPLIQHLGLPTKVTWYLEPQQDKTTLFYSEVDHEPIPIMTWQNARPEFRFLDAQGELQSSWPDDNRGTGLPFDLFENPANTALPQGVAIIDDSSESVLFWYVSISNNTLPEVDPAL